MPFLPVLAVLAVGVAAFLERDKIKALFASKSGASAPVSVLALGTNYAVVTELGGASTPGVAGSFTDAATAAQFLTDFFTSTGLAVTRRPELRDAASRTKFAAQQPSTWVLTGTWVSDEPFVRGDGHPAVGQTLFTPLS
jgi:hypothetical protein